MVKKRKSPQLKSMQKHWSGRNLVGKSRSITYESVWGRPLDKPIGPPLASLDDEPPEAKPEEDDELR